MWDMCNEPFQYDKIHNLTPELRQMLIERESRFFLQCIEAFRETGAEQPLTMGFMDPTWPELDSVCREMCIRDRTMPAPRATPPGARRPPNGSATGTR